MTEHGLTDEELHAFIDNELSPADMRRVEAIVNASPALQRQVELFAADKALIHTTYSSLIEQPLPAAIVEALSGGCGSHRRDIADCGFSVLSEPDRDGQRSADRRSAGRAAGWHDC
jgi:anti-sigma factor RsiW